MSSKNTESARIPSDLREQLTCLPVRNMNITVLDQDDQRVAVEVPLKYPWFVFSFVKKVMKLHSTKSIELDAVGSRVFKMMDGKTTVEDIIDDVKDKHLLTFFEARALVLEYIRNLVARGLAAVVVQQKQQS